MIDFQEVKAKVSIEEAVKLLNLNLVPSETGLQLRGKCPACTKGGDRNLVVTPAKGVYYCFTQQKGGDVIALAAHVQSMSFRQAAEYLSELAKVDKVVNGEKKAAEPQRSHPPRRNFDPDEYMKGLDPKHALVQELGIPEDLCKGLGMGVPSKGVHQGRFTFPIRDETGRVVFFASASDFKLPKKWGSNGP